MNCCFRNDCRRGGAENQSDNGKSTLISCSHPPNQWCKKHIDCLPGFFFALRVNKNMVSEATRKERSFLPYQQQQQCYLVFAINEKVMCLLRAFPKRCAFESVTWASFVSRLHRPALLKRLVHSENPSVMSNSRLSCFVLSWLIVYSNANQHVHCFSFLLLFWRSGMECSL